MSRTEVIYLAVLILLGSAGFYTYDRHLADGLSDEAEVGAMDDETAVSSGNDDEGVVGAAGDNEAGVNFYDSLPGFYREVNQKTKTETKNLFLITADLSLYRLLMTQVKYSREYLGVVGGDALVVRPDGSFSYDEYEGRRIAVDQWESHSQLDSIQKMNRLCMSLMKALNRYGIELSLRLDREKPEYTDKQMRLVRLMINEPQKLIAYMQDRGFETIWINDYLNERLYNLSGYLVVPASIKEEPEVIFAALADGTYVLESMD